MGAAGGCRSRRVAPGHRFLWTESVLRRICSFPPVCFVLSNKRPSKNLFYLFRKKNKNKNQVLFILKPPVPGAALRTASAPRSKTSDDFSGGTRGTRLSAGVEALPGFSLPRCRAGGERVAMENRDYSSRARAEGGLAVGF